MFVTTWKYHNPDYNITVIFPDTIQTYTTEIVPEDFTKQGKLLQFLADWVRLCVLKDQGGIWMDMTMVVTGSLDFILDKQLDHDSEGFVYRLNVFSFEPPYPLIEPWFIATIPHGAFITHWFKEFDYIFRSGGGVNYIKNMKERYGQEIWGNIIEFIGDYKYGLVHVAAQKVLQVDKIPALYNEPATEPQYGPYYLYGNVSKWDFADYGRMWIEPFSGDVPILSKLTGGIRSQMMHHLHYDRDPNETTSLWYRYLRQPIREWRLDLDNGTIARRDEATQT
jgi:Capsular polysaccharide synthesis protein